MTIREYNLARQGHERQQKDRLRTEAQWMAMILNSQYVEAKITPAMLLGEEPAETESAKADLKAAEKKLAKLTAKGARAPADPSHRRLYRGEGADGR